MKDKLLLLLRGKSRFTKSLLDDQVAQTVMENFV